MVEAPRRADAFKLQVAQVAEGQMSLGQHRTLLHHADALG